MGIGQVTDVLPDPVLTGLAVELGTGGAGAADVIAPVAIVEKDDFKYGMFGREDIKDDVKMTVAPGVPAPELSFNISYKTASVEERKGKSKIADTMRKNAPPGSLDRRRTTMLTNRLTLGVEVAVRDLCQTAPITRPTPTIKWDAANAKIRSDILAAKSAFRRQAGWPPNVIVIPPVVFDVVADDPEVTKFLERRKDLMASEVIEILLGMKVVVPGQIVDQSNPGAAANIADLWNSDEVYYVYVDFAAGDDLEAITALRQVRSRATGAEGIFIQSWRDPDASAGADWISAHLHQVEIRQSDDLILRHLDVLT